MSPEQPPAQSKVPTGQPTAQKQTAVESPSGKSPACKPKAQRPKPLRCHLLIGPPASGKSTLATRLAPLLSAPGEPEAVVISADNHRAEIYGETETQGSWPEIEAVLHQRIGEAVASGHPVIVDATHVRRPWRTSTSSPPTRQAAGKA